jgi:phosphoribosylformylglycinamidine synthase
MIATMSSRPRCLILRASGTNCDRELAFAFSEAGAAVESVHLNELQASPERVGDYALIGLPGGFSYGDDVAAGRILAERIRHQLGEALASAAEAGTAIIGICNGFQVLLKLGLLPEIRGELSGDGVLLKQRATLSSNVSGRFIDRWVGLEAEADSPCIWTRGLASFDLPVAHAEGRFSCVSAEELRRWEQSGLIALRYAAGENPNGSMGDAAGVCDRSGRILGLMPHPERYVLAAHRPDCCERRVRAAAGSATAESEAPPGLAVFRNAVRYAEGLAAGESASAGESRR